MTRIRRTLLTAAVVAAGPAAGVAQTTGSATSTTGGGSTAGGSSSGPNTANLGIQGLSSTPTISGLSSTAATRSALSTSNAFGAYYGNPLYLGRAGAAASSSGSAAALGGFGTALYGTPTGGGTGSGSTRPTGSTGNAFSASAGGVSSAASGFGGNAGTGQFGGQGANRGQGGFGGGQNQGFGSTGAQSGGVVVPLPVPIAYTARIDFPVTRPAAQQVAVDLRGMLDRSSRLSSAGTIDVFTDGTLVVLRGTVPTADEARTAEGMVRLTPGVRDVRNELVVTAPAVGP